jgi:hypothetical protein
VLFDGVKTDGIGVVEPAPGSFVPDPLLILLWLCVLVRL